MKLLKSLSKEHSIFFLLLLSIISQYVFLHNIFWYINWMFFLIFITRNVNANEILFCYFFFVFFVFLILCWLYSIWIHSLSSIFWILIYRFHGLCKGLYFQILIVWSMTKSIFSPEPFPKEFCIFDKNVE